MSYRIYFKPIVAVLTAVLAVVCRLKIVINLWSKRGRLFFDIINSDIGSFMTRFALLELTLVSARYPAATRFGVRASLVPGRGRRCYLLSMPLCLVKSTRKWKVKN